MNRMPGNRLPQIQTNTKDRRNIGKLMKRLMRAEMAQK